MKQRIVPSGDAPLLSKPVPDPQLPPLKAARLNASEHAEMLYRALCARVRARTKLEVAHMSSCVSVHVDH